MSLRSRAPLVKAETGSAVSPPPAGPARPNMYMRAAGVAYLLSLVTFAALAFQPLALAERLVSVSCLPLFRDFGLRNLKQLEVGRAAGDARFFVLVSAKMFIELLGAALAVRVSSPATGLAVALAGHAAFVLLSVGYASIPNLPLRVIASIAASDVLLMSLCLVSAWGSGWVQIGAAALIVAVSAAHAYAAATKYAA